MRIVAFLMVLSVLLGSCVPRVLHSVKLRSVSQNSSYIKPSTYTATPGDGKAVGGLFDYKDETGRQLVDGLIGQEDVFASLQQGPAYEWVGWLKKDPVLRFRFPKRIKAQRILIGFNRSSTYTVALPTRAVINGVPFAFSGDEIPNHRRGFVGFVGPFEGSEFEIKLYRRNAWLFVDEVLFVTDPPQR
jgi:hypothetical protein